MNRYKLIGLTVGVSIFLLTLVAGILIHWRFAYYRVWLSSTSPNQKYTVELTGDKGRGGFLIYSVVKYNILVNREPFTMDRLVHYGDSMDISFELAYPEHAWINENTLRFWSNRHRREDNLDTLLISNNTDKVIRFLRIKAWDMFFVFDVQPRSQLKLSFTHRSEGKGISVEGEFEDGSLIDYGVGFLENGSRDPLGYCMTIDYDRVTINSPRERAYNHRGNWNNLNLDPSPNCAP
jgi:hypothetical protein